MISLLLVEDEPDYAFLMRAMLANVRDMQFAVEEAHTLVAAISALELHGYDLILADLGLPDSRELATLAALQAVATRTPIIVVSAHPDEQLPLRALQGGAQDYLVKGAFDEVALGRVIQYAIERQRTQRAMQESERKYRALVEQASDSIFISTADGTLLDVNNQGCVLLGYSRAELLGSSVNALLAPLGTSPPPESLAALRAGELTRYELLLRRKDGDPVTVELASKMLDDGRIQSIARDITARKKAEETLRARVRQEEALAALGQQALAASDLHSLMERAVALVVAALQVAFCEILELLPDGKSLLLRAGFGWQPGLVGHATVGSELASQAGYTMLSDAAVIVDDLRREQRFSGAPLLIDHDVVSGMSVVIRTTEGPFGVLGAHTTRTRFFSDYDVIFMGAIASILAAAIGRDRAERALRAGERQFRAVFDNTLSAIFIVDDERLFLKVNPAAIRLLGLPRDELIGLRMDDIIEPAKAALLAPSWLNFLADGSMDGEFTICRPDGETRLVQLESTASILPGQHLLSMIDVTERQQAAEALLVQQRTQAANEAKNEFLAHLSHELRTPLNAILGFSQLLEMGTIEGEDRESVELIIGAGRHLLEMINELLDISSMESGKLTLSPELLTVDEVLTDSLRLIAPAAAVRGITISSEIAGLAQVPVLADRYRLKQVMLNLLANAVKYNRVGGTIVVSYRQEPESLRLLISDTGPGIPAAKIALLFTPFERLGLEDSAVEGTGLGLAICKQLIEAMNGQIGAASVPGEGSTFWFSLPVALAQQTGAVVRGS